VPYRDSPFQELKVPLTWTAGVAAVLAAALAVALFVSDRKDQARVDAEALGHAKVRAGFDMGMAPVSGLLAAPVRWVNDGAASVGDYFFAVSENRRLKKEIAQLQQVRIDDIALHNLNRRYEELLKLRTEPPIPMVTARVVTDTRGPFSNARLIDVGTDGGVKIGNPAMTEQGVVGRVVGVSPNASRLLLLTDPESRTPVLIDRTNARAVLTGDGGPNPRLEYLRGKDPVRSGDRVLTSGDGGIFPRGLPVGVAEQDIRGVWRIRLYSESGSIDFVRVLVYDDFSQAVDQAKLAEAALPPLDAADAAKLKVAETAPPPSAAASAPPGAPAAAAPPGTPSAARPPPARKPTRPGSDEGLPLQAPRSLDGSP
jgi:rod shape-determining protein MreC